MNSDIEQLASLAHSQLAHQSVESVPDASHATKRKSEDDQTPSGKKRSRYISLACNECKRRKIKCNGQQPCQRCGNLNLECVYAPNCCTGFKDSQEYREFSAQIVSLQEQVNLLYENMNGLRAQLGQQPLTPATQQQYQHLPSIDPSLQIQAYTDGATYGQQESPNASRPRSQAHNHAAFRGLNNTDFGFGGAKSGAQSTGYPTQENEDTNDDNHTVEEGNQNGERMYKQFIARGGQFHEHVHESKDPIWTISHDEAIRLCHVYEEETSMLCPVLDVDRVKAHANKLFPFLAAMRRSGLMQQGMPGADAVEDEDTNVLKMVIAIALTAENGGQSELGRRFYDTVQPENDILLLEDPNVNSVRLLIMMAFYELLHNKESTTYRLTGLASRLCIDVGLNRSTTYEAIGDNTQRAETRLLLWTCYVLDRRWSFSPSTPFALQDDDIDSHVPRPGDASPFLTAMIESGEIGNRISRAIMALISKKKVGASAIDHAEMDHLDHQVTQWHSSLPLSLKYDGNAWSGFDAHSVAARASLRARLVLHLRTNQIRLLAHRSALQSEATITQHYDRVQKVFDIAKDSIRTLTSINRSTDLYRTQQVFFHEFTLSALAVLFLTIGHAPTYFASAGREEFYMALDLVRSLKKGSLVSKRLSQTIRSLMAIIHQPAGQGEQPSLANAIARHDSQREAPKTSVDPSRSAAVAMAGLAGHNVDETALFDGDTLQPWLLGVEALDDPSKMATHLVRLFEAFGSPSEARHSVNAAPGDATAVQTSGTDANHPVAGAPGKDELFDVLKDLFW